MSWEGQPAKLLDEQELVAQRHKVNTNHKSWPKEVRWLTRRQPDSIHLLEGLGIEVQIKRLTDTSKGRSKANTSSIVIRKMIPMTPIEQNHAQNTDIGDIGQIGDILDIEGDGGSFSFECYHNGCDFHTNDEKEYHLTRNQKHTVFLCYILPKQN